MTKLNNLSSRINANDNYTISWWKYREYNEYAVHTQTANVLIKKYCKQWWKNHPESGDYQIASACISMDLGTPGIRRDEKLQSIAQELRCSIFDLSSDPMLKTENPILGSESDVIKGAVSWSDLL